MIGNRYSVLFPFLLCVLQSLAQNTGVKRYAVDIALGVQSEDLQWSIAGNMNGQHPNVLSELIWKGLTGPNIKAQATGRIWKGVELTASFSGTRIVNGRAWDTDYGGDNRTEKGFEVRLESDRGHGLSYGLMAGYGLSWGKRMLFTPSLGYHWHRQHLFLLDKVALESTYQTRWHGPAVNLSVAYTFNYWAYAAAVSYVQQRYHAVADWNLIDAFAHPISFRHQANGYHIGLANKFILLPQAKLTPFFFFDNEFARTGAGIDTLYFVSGETSYTRLNGVRRHVKAIGFGLTASW